MLKCEIISIGDELLLGDTVNTNASWMGRALTPIGVDVIKVHTIRDDELEITRALKESASQADIVLTTGGLGPTHDDKTKKVVANFFGVSLVVHRPTLEHIKQTFKKRHIPFSKSNYGQAEVPENCEVLFNRQGTAPGLWFNEDDYHLAVLPGIPEEVKFLMTNEVLPRLRRLTQGHPRLYTRFLKTSGIGESTLSDKVLPELTRYLSDDMSVAFLPSIMENTIRITVKAESADAAKQKAKPLIQYIYGSARNYIIGEGENITLSEATGKILEENGLTISAAESCTGGLLASRLTDVPGSSNYMIGGLTAYANMVKTEQLNIPDQIIKECGAVSLPVALQMAKEVAALMQTDIGVSTTGIAGPGGGSHEKPVGTVWVGFWSNDAHFALKTQFTKNRLLNKERSVALALEMIRRTLLNIKTMPYSLNPYHA